MDELIRVRYNILGPSTTTNSHYHLNNKPTNKYDGFISYITKGFTKNKSQLAITKALTGIAKSKYIYYLKKV